MGNNITNRENYSSEGIGFNHERLNPAHYISILMLGFSTLVTQLILLRKFMAVFYGNELVLGIILATWMLLTGLGGWLGKFYKGGKTINRHLPNYLLILGILPVITVFSLYFVKGNYFHTGEMVDLTQVIVISLILLAPFCVISGSYFTLVTGAISDYYRANMISRAYSIEAQGSIVGGVLFNAVLVYILPEIWILVIIFILNGCAAVFLLIKENRYMHALLFVLALPVFSIPVLKFDLDTYFLKLIYPNQDIKLYKDTPYGRLVITERGDQVNFYENNVLLFNDANIKKDEENIHYALSQVKEPQNVLLISGGISGGLQEVLKYSSVKHIDYLEINPWVIKLGRRITKLPDNSKIDVVTRDPRIFLRKTNKKYDAALINIPEPKTAQLNRYYTLEFFQSLKEKLTEKAVVSSSLPSTANYISKEARKYNSVIYSTLKEEFENVLIVPGNKNYFISSDTELTLNIPRLISQKNIKTQYVNKYYLDTTSLKDRSRYIRNKLNVEAQLNRDFKPLAYYHHLQYWLSLFKSKLWIPSAIVGVGFLIMLWRMNTLNMGMFAAGLTGSALEVILLIAFQVIYGYVYQITGIIVTIFMAGIALGSWKTEFFAREISLANFRRYLFYLASLALLLPAVLLLIKSLGRFAIVIHGIFFVLTLITSTIIGVIFSLISGLQKEKIIDVAGKLYSVDLLGSALGAIMVSVFFIPLMGLWQVCFILAALNFAAFGLTYIKQDWLR